MLSRGKTTDVTNDLEFFVEAVMAMACLGMGFCGLFALLDLVGLFLATVSCWRGVPVQVAPWGPPAAAWLTLIAPFLAILLLATWVRSHIDIHFKLDTDREEVMLSRKIFFFSSHTPVVRFSDIHCLAVDGSEHTRSQGADLPGLKYWKTRLVLVTHSGRLIPISDFREEGTWDPTAQRFDQVLDVRLVTPPDSARRKTLTVSKAAGGELTLNYPDVAAVVPNAQVTHPLSSAFWLAMVIIIVAAPYGLFQAKNWLVAQLFGVP